MERRGFTLIEIIISLSILSILIVMSLGFVYGNEKIYSSTSKDIDGNVNLRIGLEFLINEILDADKIELIDKSSGKEIVSRSILVTNVSGTIGSYLKINGDLVYIKNSILRNDTLSQQVVSGIKAFSIEYRGEGLYKIVISSDKSSLSTIIYKRE